MKAKGTITTWNDEKGYGFISPQKGGERTFVHVKEFANRSRRPVVGDVVTYTTSADSRGRPTARKASIAGSAISPASKNPSGFYSNALALGFLSIVGGAASTTAIPFSILLAYLAVSVVTFAAYALDKMAARRGGWRTSESTLHVLALVGGWPGALIAQHSLRHKTRKQPFRMVFWITVVLNCAGFAWLFTPEGADTWRSLVPVIE